MRKWAIENNDVTNSLQEDKNILHMSSAKDQKFMGAYLRR